MKKTTIAKVNDSQVEIGNPVINISLSFIMTIALTKDMRWLRN